MLLLFYAIGAALPLLAVLRRNWPPLMVCLSPVGMAIWGAGLALVASGIIPLPGDTDRAYHDTYYLVLDARLTTNSLIPPFVAGGLFLGLAALRAMVFPRAMALSALALHAGLFLAQVGLVFFLVYPAPRREIDPLPLFAALNTAATTGAMLALAAILTFLGLVLLSVTRRVRHGPRAS